MPETYYHVDRWDDLAAGRTVTLDAFEGGVPEVDAAVEEYFPAGVSRHGRHYCEADLYSDDADDVWDVACEIIFEAVRRARFPDRPSRFQSVFAFETLDEVDEFADEHVDSSYTVWTVEAAGGFAGDMHLVDAESLADGLRRADAYWRGETFTDDPLREVLLRPPVRVLERVDSGDPSRPT